MNEIIIEDKKYISSKRAAEVTGYAKDYIGQLCREGRVPARLIGRNWYVLESAIQDHRFGDPAPIEIQLQEKKSASRFSPDTWEAPRYEAGDGEELPPVKPVDETTTPRAEEGLAPIEKESVTDMREAWQAWFDQSQHQPAQAAVEEPAALQELAEAEEQEVSIPIRTMRYIPSQTPAPVAPNLQVQSKRQPRVFTQLFGFLLALFALITLALNTGYFDTLATSYGLASVFTGISIYKK